MCRCKFEVISEVMTDENDECITVYGISADFGHSTEYYPSVFTDKEKADRLCEALNESPPTPEQVKEILEDFAGQ